MSKSFVPNKRNEREKLGCGFINNKRKSDEQKKKKKKTNVSSCDCDRINYLPRRLRTMLKIIMKRTIATVPPIHMFVFWFFHHIFRESDFVV